MSAFLAITKTEYRDNIMFKAFWRTIIAGTNKEAPINKIGEEFMFVANTTPQAILRALDCIDKYDINEYVFI